MASTGYSGRPLALKLGLRPGMKCWRNGMPDSVAEDLDAEAPDLELLVQPDPGLECAHVFVTDESVLQERLQTLRPLIAPDGMIWVSWPKKASKVPTTVTEDTVRSICLPLGLVDVKVCAVDAVWSGLKLVVRKELRKTQAGQLKERIA